MCPTRSIPACGALPSTRTAVFVVETTLVLPQSAASVFVVAGSLALASRWRAGVSGGAGAASSALVAPPEVRTGADGLPPAVLAFRALGARYAMPTRALAWEPPHHAAWHGRTTAFTLDLALTLEELPGGTRVTYRCGLALASDDVMPAARATALRRLLVRRAPRDLERLRALVACAGGAHPPSDGEASVGRTT